LSQQLSGKQQHGYGHNQNFSHDSLVGLKIILNTFRKRDSKSMGLDA